MILESELAEDEDELVAPAVEVARVDVEDGGDVVSDIVDGDILGVQLQHRAAGMPARVGDGQRK